MPALREGDEVTPDWADPEYRAAKLARAEAYAEFCTAAGANPHMAGKPAWFEYYKIHVQPLRLAFMAASDRWRAETARVIRESEGTS
jgi:hypothetical protein